MTVVTLKTGVAMVREELSANHMAKYPQVQAYKTRGAKGQPQSLISSLSP